jgi:hypothetical protein
MPALGAGAGPSLRPGPGAPAAGGVPGAPGGGAGMARPAGRDLNQMLETMPNIKVADLKPGEQVVVSSTKGSHEGEITAIVLLSNADFLIQQASGQGAGAAGGQPGGGAGAAGRQQGGGAGGFGGGSGGMGGMGGGGFGGLDLSGMTP